MLKFAPWVPLAVALASTAAAQGTRYVDAALTTGNNNGSSWADAFQGPNGLQAALANTVPSTRIYVAGGTYFPSATGDPTASFVLPPGTSIYGGFRGNEVDPQGRPAFGTVETVLSGDLAGDDDLPGGSRADNSHHVVTAFGGSFNTIDGCTIVAGNAPSSSPGGGGLLSTGAFRVTDCRFTGNHAFQDGGAIHSDDGTRLLDCTFEDNFAGLGSGGAVHFGVGSACEVDRCTFMDNTCLAAAGAIDLGRGTVANSLFQGNSASESAAVRLDGTTLARPVIDHCTFTLNLALDSPASALKTTVGGPAQPGVLAVSSSIFWGNTLPPVDGRELDPSLTAAHSIIEGGHPGTAILDVDPLFTDPANHDFRLGLGSPAVDIGDGSSFGSAKKADLRRARREVDDPLAPNAGPDPLRSTDLGAYERTTAISSSATFCNAVPNSGGLPGRADAYGSASLLDNDVTLVASDLPLGSFAYFIVSRSYGFVPQPGGSPGNLCLAGQIGRFIGPGQVQSSGTSGTISVPIDLMNIPTPTGFTPVLPGDSWHFQCWHRDLPFPGFASWNMTDSAFFTFH